MSGEIVIPVWAFLALWAVAGRLIASQLMDSLLTRTLVGEPTLGDRMRRLPLLLRLLSVALVLVAGGPLVWLSTLRATAEEAWQALRRKLRRERG